MRGILSLFFLLMMFGVSSSFVFSQEDIRLEYASAKQINDSQEEFKKGYYYYNNMAYEAAISFFRTAISIYPKNDLAQYWLGRSYLMAGYTDLAIVTWEALLKDSKNKQGLFLQQELENLYVEGFKSSLEVDKSGTQFAFLRMINTMSNPSCVAIDNNNNLYISDFYKGRINIYDANLRKIHLIKENLLQPTNIAFHENLLFISAFGSNSVRVYDMENSYKFLYEFGGFGFEAGKLAGPVGLAFADDRLYVVDQGNNRVQIFQISPKPYFIGEFGKRGHGQGEFNIPTGIAVYNHQVWVLDRMNSRIQIFDLEGNYIRQITSSDIQSPIQAFVFQSQFYVVDQDSGLFRLNADNNTFSLLQTPTQGLQRLSSAFIDRNGILFLSEVSNPTVIAYTQDTNKISSLNVRTQFVTTSGYPKVVMKLRIRDTHGEDIKGLNSSNVTVTQDGYKMGEVQLSPLVPTNKRTSLTILVRATPDTFSEREKILQYLFKIIDSKKPDDKIRIMTYNKEQKVIIDFSQSKLALKNAISKYEWYTDKLLVSDDVLDQALYEALDSNEFNDSYNAILTIDNNSETTFKKYSEEVLANHSERIGVPIYVVNLNLDVKDLKEKSLRFLARKSGGEYFSFTKSNNIFDVLSIIKRKSPLFYTLSYTNPPVNSVLSGYWANVVLHVEYRSLHGVDQLGYLVNL